MAKTDKQDPAQKDKKWAKIPEDWRIDMLGRKDPTDLRDAIVKAAMNLVALEAAKEADMDLASLQEELATARAMYTDGKKENSLKIAFLIEVLRGREVDVPEASDFLKVARVEASQKI